MAISNNSRERKRACFASNGAGAGVYIIITLTLLGSGFALISPSTVTATPSNTTNTTTTTPEEESTTSAPIQLVTPSAAAQQIINNTQAECEQAQFHQKRCVFLVYDSPTTVVLNGLVSIYGGPENQGLYSNPFLWNAVDAFKAQGYTITTIEMNVVGNKSSDDQFYVVMSK
jgi:hypothetical protein